MVMLIRSIVVHQYNVSMNLVDHSDHTLSTSVALTGSKLFFHNFNMLILNSYILLYTKAYGAEKMSLSAYREYMVSHHLFATSYL